MITKPYFFPFGAIFLRRTEHLYKSGAGKLIQFLNLTFTQSNKTCCTLNFLNNCFLLIPATDRENDILTEEIVLTPTSCEIGTTSLYTFIRYTFDGVDLENTDTVVVYLDILYGEEQAHRGTLRLFHRESETVERELTSKEKGIISK